MSMTFSLFWTLTMRRFVPSYQRFGAIYSSHLQSVNISKGRTSWTA